MPPSLRAPASPVVPPLDEDPLDELELLDDPNPLDDPRPVGEPLDEAVASDKVDPPGAPLFGVAP
jgi:hypothetical protein